MFGLYLILAVCIHLVIFFSVYEMFLAPEIEIIKSHEIEEIKPALSKRVVMVVYDSLSASKVFELDTTAHGDLTFLNKPSSYNETWGLITITDPKKEPKLLHESFFAGFHGDALGQINGYNQNDHLLDTIFQKVSASWVYGRDSTLQLINSSTATLLSMEPPEYVIQSKDYSSLYNNYVFNSFVNYMNTHYKNTSLWNSGVLHLLEFKGPMTDSLEIFKNNFDSVLHKVDKYVNQYYKHDEGTTFIVTSFRPDPSSVENLLSPGDWNQMDSYMPLMMWGAGIQPRQANDQVLFLKHNDIAVLLASLLSVSIPTNSKGIIRTEFLKLNRSLETLLIFKNAKQLVRLFQAKQNNKLNFFGYVRFEKMSDKWVNDTIRGLVEAYYHKNYDFALSLGIELINGSLNGMRYVKYYYRELYRTIVMAILMFWSLIIGSEVLRDKDLYKVHLFSRYETVVKNLLIGTIFILLLGGIVVTFVAVMVSGVPHYYLHFFSLPQALFAVLTVRVDIFMTFIAKSMTKSFANAVKWHAKWFIYLVAIEMMTISMKFRHCLSILSACLGIWMAVYCNTLQVPPKLAINWILSILAVSIFPLIESFDTNSTTLQYPRIMGFALILWISACFFNFFEIITNESCKIGSYLNKSRSSEKKPACYENMVYKLQFCHILFAAGIVIATKYTTIFETYTSCFLCFTWYLCVLDFALVFLTPLRINVRLVYVATAISVPIILSSNGLEPLFYFALVYNLIMWLEIERIIHRSSLMKNSRQAQCLAGGEPHGQQQLVMYQSIEDSYGKTNISDTKFGSNEYRRVLFLFFYITISLFGTIDIENMYNYDTKWLENYFNNDEVGYLWWLPALARLKFVLPTVTVFCFARTIFYVTNIKITKIFFVAEIFANIVVAHVLYIFMEHFHETLESASLSLLILGVVNSFVLLVPSFYLIAYCLTNVAL